MKQLNFSEKNKSSEDELNKVNDHMNRGFELILNGRKKENLKTFNIQFPGGKKMTIDTKSSLPRQDLQRNKVTHKKNSHQNKNQ